MRFLFSYFKRKLFAFCCFFLVICLIVSLIPNKAFADVGEMTRVSAFDADTSFDLNNYKEGDIESNELSLDNEPVLPNYELNNEQESQVEDDLGLVGTGDKSNPYLVYNFQQLMTAFHFPHASIKLCADISVSTEENEHRYFNYEYDGVFDGCGHSLEFQKCISNIYNLDSCSANRGLFYKLKNNSVIKNLNLKMDIESTNENVGILSNFVEGNVLIDNVNVFGSVKSSHSVDGNVLVDSINVFAGIKYSNGFKSCSVGGFFGYVESGSNIVFNNCCCDASVIAEALTVRYAGGFIGKSDTSNLTFENCNTSDHAIVSAVGSVSNLFKYTLELTKFIILTTIFYKFYKWDEAYYYSNRSRQDNLPENYAHSRSDRFQSKLLARENYEYDLSGDNEININRDVEEGDINNNEPGGLVEIKSKIPKEDEVSVEEDIPVEINELSKELGLDPTNLRHKNDLEGIRAQILDLRENLKNIVPQDANYKSAGFANYMRKIKSSFCGLGQINNDLYTKVQTWLDELIDRIVVQENRTFGDVFTYLGTLKDSLTKYLSVYYGKSFKPYMFNGNEYEFASVEFQESCKVRPSVFSKVFAESFSLSNLCVSATNLATTISQLSYIESSELTWNSYAGGFVGYFSGDSESSKLKTINSINCASVIAGHDAGGFFGCAQNFLRMDYQLSKNIGNISAQDAYKYPNSGGFIGAINNDSSEFMDVSFDLCASLGFVESRYSASGFIGQTDNDKLKCCFKNCALFSCLYASENVGGYIGCEDSSYSVSIENSYAWCVLDNYSISDSENPIKKFIFGIAASLQHQNIKSLNEKGHVGASVGRCDHPDRLSLCDFFTFEGLSIINNGSGDDVNIKIIKSFTEGDLRSGSLAYKLNNEGINKGLFFGQILDVHNYEDCSIPLPDIEWNIYKNECCGENIMYSNYDFRYCNIHQLVIQGQNVTCCPSYNKVNVIDGSGYSFNIKISDGFQLDRAYIVFGDKIQDIDCKKNTDNTYSINLNNIIDDCTVNFVTKKKSEIKPKGTGTANDPFLISNEDELKWFNENINKTLSSEWCVKLMNDIDCQDIDWSPILENNLGLNSGYHGIFDGNNKKIYNVSSKHGSCLAFFANVSDGAIIKNLTIDGKFNNAVFAYRASGAIFQNCISSGSVYSHGEEFCSAGIVAFCTGSCLIENCTNFADIKLTTSNRFASACGGIVGGFFPENRLFNKMDIEDDSNNPYFINSGKILDCKNFGYIELYSSLYKDDNKSFSGYSAGGIVGTVSIEDVSKTNENYSCVEIQCLIDDCFNGANVWSNVTAGGIVGSIYEVRENDPNNKTTNFCHIFGCHNTGNIGYLEDGNFKRKANKNSGGIIGLYHSNFYLWMKSCFNSGNCYAMECSGLLGVIEYDDGVDCGNTIENSVNIGDAFSDLWSCFHGLLAFEAIGENSSSSAKWTWINCWCKKIEDRRLIGGPLHTTVRYSATSDFDGVKDSRGKLFKPTVNILDDNMISSGALAFILNGHYVTKSMQIDQTTKNFSYCGEYLSQINYDKDYYGQDLNASLNSNKDNFMPCLKNLFDTSTVYCLGYEDNAIINEDYYNNLDYKKDYIGFTNSEPIYSCSTEHIYNMNINIKGKGKLIGYNYVYEGNDFSFKIIPDDGWMVSTIKDHNSNEEIEILDGNQIRVFDVHEDKTIDVEFINCSVPEKDDKGNYLIKSNLDFEWFAQNYGSDKNVNNAILCSDIEINNDQFTQIGFSKKFKGCFNGGNHKITMTNTSKPLFLAVETGSEIFSLNIEINSVSEGFSSVLVEQSYGVNIHDVDIEGSVFGGNGDAAGYVVQVLGEKTVFRNCNTYLNLDNSNTDDVHKNTGAFAAFVSFIKSGNLDIADCSNYGNIYNYAPSKSIWEIAVDYLSSSSGTRYAAAAVGKIIEDSTVTNTRINNFTNFGDIYAQDCAAGIVGYIQTKDVGTESSRIILRQSSNSGLIKSNGNTSGLAGEYYTDDNGSLIIIGCVSSGSIETQKLYPSSPKNAAGVLARMKSDARCYIARNIISCDHISCEGPNSGGVIGYSDYCCDLGIFGNLILTDKFSSTSHIGHIIAQDDEDGTVEWSFNYHVSNKEPIGNSKHTPYDPPITNEDAHSGKALYEWLNNSLLINKINEYFSARSLAYLFDNLNFGQVVDLCDSLKEDFPHIDKNNIVYQVPNGNTYYYSNYDMDSNHFINEKLVRYSSLSPKQNGTAPNNTIVKSEDNINSCFYGNNNNILSELKLNGISLDLSDKKIGSYSHDFSIYQLNIDAKLLKDILGDSSNTSVLTFEYEFTDRMKPKCLNDDNSCIYQISNPFELNWYCNYVNNYDSSAIANIVNDIDMGSFEWNQIGKDKKFTGRIYGNNNSIINVKGDVDSLISSADGAVLKDIKLNVYFKGKDVAGCVKDASNVTLLNIDITGKLEGEGIHAGGLITNAEGNSNDFVADNLHLFDEQFSNYVSDNNSDFGTFVYSCTNNLKMSFDHSEDYANKNDRIINAGFVAYQKENSSLVIAKCTNNCKINSNRNNTSISDTGDFCAGILGYTSLCSDSSLLYDCVNNAELCGFRVGGIVGGAGDFYQSINVNSNLRIVKCCQKGILKNGKYVGGAIGLLYCKNSYKDYVDVSIDEFINYGIINSEVSSSTVAGLISYVDGNCFKVYINNSANVGCVFARTAAAGFIASLINVYIVKITHSYNYGDIACSDGDYGQIFGKECQSDKSILSHCFIAANGIKAEGTTSNMTSSFDSQDDDRNHELTMNQFENGELCSLLNDDNDCHPWGQDLSNGITKEYYPVLGSLHQSCDFANKKDNEKSGIFTLNTNVNDTNKGNLYFVNKDGSIGNKLSKSNFVYYGSDVKVAFIPVDGCYIDDVKMQTKSDQLLNEENITSKLNNNIFTIENISSDILLDVSFSIFMQPKKSQDGIWQIDSYASLLWFADQVNNKGNKYIKGEVINDIDATPYASNPWIPIGIDQNNPFCGSLVGNNANAQNGKKATIKGISPNRLQNVSAFINYAKGVEIKDLSLEDVDILSNEEAGGLIYKVIDDKDKQSSIENVYISGKITSSGYRMGGIVGVNESRNIKIISCVCEVEFSQAVAEGACVGGIVGLIDARLCKSETYYDIENCVNLSNIYSNRQFETSGRTIGDTLDDYGAGIVARIIGDSSFSTNAILKNNNNFALIFGEKAAGIVSSVTDFNSFILNIDSCNNFGNVMGDYCAGIVSFVDNVDSDSSLDVVRSSNWGPIGSQGVAYWDAGGIIGVVNDKDITTNLMSSYNTGSVLNTATSSSACEIAKQSTIFAFTTAPFVILIAETLLTLIFPFLSLLASTFVVAFAVVNLVVNVQNSGSYITQKAGGLCANFEAYFGHVNIKDCFNTGYVNGENETGSICASFDTANSNCDIKNTFVLKNQYTKDDKDYSDYDKNHIDVEYVTEKNFESGEVGFKLQNGVLWNTDYFGHWGQVLDNFTLGEKSSIPVLCFDDAIIYEHKNQNSDTDIDKVTYSNFPQNDDLNKLNINMLEEDDKNASWIKTEDNFADYDVSFQSIMTNKNTLITDEQNDISIHKNEDFVLNIKPKDNERSVFDVVQCKPNLNNNNTCPIEVNNVIFGYDYFKDGSFIKYGYDSDKAKLNDKEKNQWNYKITYNTDGSVQFYYKNTTSLDGYDFCIVNKKNPIKILPIGKDDNLHIIFPWNSDNSLPSYSNNFYLSENVDLLKSYSVPEQDSSLCLNSHNIKLGQNVCINVRSENSSYSLYDITNNDSLNSCYIESDFVKFADECNLDSDLFTQLRTEGSIYSDGNNDLSMFNIENANVSFDNINLIQQNRSVLTFESTQKSKVKMNTKLIRSDSERQKNKIHATYNLGRSNTCISKSEDCQGVLEFGDEYTVLDKNTNNNIDINFKKYNTPVISFDDNYLFDYVFNLASESENPVVVSNDFEKYIKCGIDYKSVFNIIDNSFVLAFFNSENIDEEGNDSYNNICITKKDKSVFVQSSVNGEGDVIPSGDNYYIEGTNAKYYYKAHQFYNLVSVAHNVVYDINSSHGSKHKHSDDKILLDNYVMNNTSGEFIVENVCGHYDKDNKSLKVNNELCFDFISLDNIEFSSINGSWFSIQSETDLLDLKNNFDETKHIRLDDDIYLNQSWVVPEGDTILDLNGHLITWGSNENRNNNLIILDKENSKLSITDSCITDNKANNKESESTSHYFKNDLSNNKFIPCNQDDEGAIEVVGGMIGCCDISPNTYYVYNQNSGAILVNKGSLNIVAGNIAGNNSRDVLGGAAITGYEDTTIIIGENTNIMCNSCCGKDSYIDKFFSAGIATKGLLINNGVISHNVAGSVSSSAVMSYNLNFLNNGCIVENSCVDINLDNGLPYAAVYSRSGFNNNGTICNNTSDYSTPAIVSYGPINLNKKSKIFNNSCIYKYDDTYNTTHWDIFTNSALSLSDEYTTEDTPIYIYKDLYSEFTKDWNLKSKISDYFAPVRSELIGDSGEYKISLSQAGQLFLADSKNVIDVKVESCDNGNIDFAEGPHLKNNFYELKVSPENYYSLLKVTLNNKDIKVYSANNINYYLLFNENSDSEKAILRAEFIKNDIKDDNKEFSDATFESCCQVYWLSENSLPSVPGKYVLCNDVILSDLWTSPVGDIYIDLNGHNITSDKKNNKGLMDICSKSRVYFDDSNLIDRVQYFDIDKNHNYILKDFSLNELHGGIIGGFNIDKTSEESHVININKDAVLVLHKGNIALNSLNGSHPLSVINTKKDSSLRIEEDFNITFNCVNRSDNDDNTKLITAIVYNEGNILNNGTICDNVAEGNCNFIIANFKSSTFINDIKGRIQFNKGTTIYNANKESLINNGIVK